MKRTYLPPGAQPPQVSLPYARPVLRTDAFLAIYARQSTKEQVTRNREAHDQQTKGLIKQARALGWTDELTIIYIENRRADGTWRNASGRLRIDQREHLQALTERIEKDEVKTVLVWAVDRLFRDEDMIQPAVFAKSCKEHHVTIITMDDVFAFDNTRNDDRKRFLDAAQAAADYITKHVRGRMLPARAQVSMRGLWDGRRIVPGYIVPDRQRYLPDGSDNPDWHKFMIYEPHTKIIRWLFHRFRQLSGNLRALHREIEAWPYVFPFFEDPAHAKDCGLPNNGKGYTITRPGLASLLTNVVYLGGWYYKGQITWHNHEAIVSEEDFWYAFNRLSSTTTEGQPNEERPTSAATRYTHDGTPPLEALLDGIVTGGVEGMSVYVLRNEPVPNYSIFDEGRKHGDHYKQSIPVVELDSIFSQRLLYVLEHTEHGATLRQHLVALRQERDQQLISVDSQIAEAKQQIARWERSKRIAREEDDEAGEREAVRALKGKNATLRALEAKSEQANIDDAELIELMELLFGTGVTWADLSYTNRQRFIRAATESVTLREASTQFLELRIVWKAHARTDTAYIWRNFANGGRYTEEDKAVLRELYPVADRAEILDRMPRRSWKGIIIQASRMGLTRPQFSCGNSSGIHRDLSRSDASIVKMLGVEYDPSWPDKLTWWVAPPDDDRSENGNAFNTVLPSTVFSCLL